MAALAGRVALVTGSSRGIGAAIARAFAREGAQVVVHGRDTAALGVVVGEIEQASGCVRQVTGDVTKAGDLDAMRADIEHIFGPVDVLVVNAGGSRHPDDDPDLAAQVGPFGIRVNCLAPETILTAKNEATIPDEMKKSLVEMHPIRRLGSPDDVARAALFLASDASPWITGQIIDVAGGAVTA